jgi:hypothetical protein
VGRLDRAVIAVQVIIDARNGYAGQLAQFRMDESKKLGGITVGGGEPLLQAHALQQLLSRCREAEDIGMMEGKSVDS